MGQPGPPDEGRANPLLEGDTVRLSVRVYGVVVHHPSAKAGVYGHPLYIPLGQRGGRTTRSIQRRHPALRVTLRTGLCGSSRPGRPMG